MMNFVYYIISVTVFVFVSICILVSVSLKSAYGVLLSDIAYFDLKQKVSSAKEWKRLYVDKKKRIDRIKIAYNHQSYTIPYKRQGRTFYLLVPNYMGIEAKITGMKRNRVVLQKAIRNPVISSSVLSHLKMLHPFQKYRGGFVFGDSVARLSVDYLEPEAQENAVVLRGIDHRLQTNWISFLSQKLNAAPIFVPPRERTGVGIMQHYLYVFQDKKVQKHNFLTRKSQVFHRDQNDTNCAGSMIDGSRYVLIKKDQKLHINVYNDLCFVFHKNTELQPVTTRILSVPSDIQKILHGLKIQYFSIEKVRSYDQNYYIVLLQFVEPYAFMLRDIASDIVMVFRDDFEFDGAFSIQNQYYSPRLNVAYLPSFEEYLAHVDTMDSL